MLGSLSKINVLKSSDFLAEKPRRVVRAQGRIPAPIEDDDGEAARRRVERDVHACARFREAALSPAGASLRASFTGERHH
ncbi:MAG: hypothetical protein KGK11_02505 [Sphingomonadales bacterium]|nr:hypothetical protein [Sphingomonadales bacterium]